MLTLIKDDFDQAASSKGPAGLLSSTRSAKPIKRLHQHVADLLVSAGVPAGFIDMEHSISTLFGDKCQDIVAIPRGWNKPTGQTTLSISVAGQMYGIQKNKDNAFSKARAELLNLHEFHGDIVLGHVQLLAIGGWDSDALKKQTKVTSFVTSYMRLSPATLAEMIQRFAKITARKPGASDGFAERVALLLVDFSKTVPVVYTDVADLEHDGFLRPNSGLSLAHLTLNDFASDLLVQHRARYTGANRL